MRVEILNWDRFQPRKDVKAPSWFRLSHSLFEDHEFYDFTHTEIVAWIYILSLASKKSSATVAINQQHVERVGRLKWKEFHVALEKLQFIQCILVEYTDTSRERNVGDTHPGATLHNKTLHNKTILPDSLREPRRQFDFESLYKKYPRKEGKQRGVAICKSQIHSPEDYAALSHAIDRYVAHVRAQGTEARFIKHFSTFMAHWRDWLEHDTGTVAKAAEEIPEWKRKVMEEERLKNGA